MILSAAMMLRYSFDRPEQATRIENAVKKVLHSGLRTGDICNPDASGSAPAQSGMQS
jgi:3-isopropylmalate dehydrogenase